MVLLLVIGAAVGAGVTLASRRSPSTSTALSLPTRTGTTPSLAPLPSAPPESSPGAGSGAPLDPATIASRIDPAIVDISVTIGGQGQGQATGMILTSSGEVLTNNHVVEGATSVSVQVNGTGPTYQATVIGVDPTDDVALIQMNGVSGLPTVPLGNSSSVAVGDQIVALGNALGRGGSPAVTPGVVTNLDQTITVAGRSGGDETLSGMMQVRAAIQPGDSGGPIVDSSGRVVAMTTAGSARARRSGGVGFGVPIDAAMSIARQIQSGGGPNILPGHRGILGIEVSGTPATGGGATVVGVQSGSPAAGAGMTSGSVITRVDGSPIVSSDGLTKYLQGHKPGDVVSVRWLDAAGRQHDARIKLASGPPA
jgi:S1-C subfamily serine protease